VSKIVSVSLVFPLLIFLSLSLNDRISCPGLQLLPLSLHVLLLLLNENLLVCPLILIFDPIETVVTIDDLGDILVLSLNCFKEAYLHLLSFVTVSGEVIIKLGSLLFLGLLLLRVSISVNWHRVGKVIRILLVRIVFWRNSCLLSSRPQAWTRREAYRGIVECLKRVLDAIECVSLSQMASHLIAGVIRARNFNKNLDFSQRIVAVLPNSNEAFEKSVFENNRVASFLR
jgi:hypothetical protein